MTLHLDLLPRKGHDYRDVVIVVDTLRSCTVAPILFQNGLKDLYVCPSIRVAKELARQHKYLLIGEKRGLPPEGFNYGNSPADLQAVTVQGASAVLFSENAPQVLPLLSSADHILLGSLYNAEALIARAATLAQGRISLVCCGFDGHEDLDDTLSAGYMVARLKQRLPNAQLSGASLMAISLLKAFPDPLEGLWHSRAGNYLRKLDLKEDIAVSGLIAQSDCVPELQEERKLEHAPIFHFATNSA